MAAPIETHVSGIEVNGGDEFTIALDLPSRGSIGKIVVAQTDGTPEGFSYDLFNSRIPSPPTEPTNSSSSVSSSSEAAGLPESLYKVLGTRTATAGTSALEYFEASGLEYVNKDSVSSAALERKLYMRIRPGGSGAKAFAVAVLVLGQKW